jgi:hypothetical protein
MLSRMFEDDDQLPFLIRRWINGDSALPAVLRLLDLDRADEAATIARVAIRDPRSPDDERALAEIREEADEALNEELDKVGVPRV